MRYLHLFNTVSAYTEARETEYFEPWVSLTKANDEVNYNKSEYEKLLETPLTFEILSGGSLSWSYYDDDEGYLDATKVIYYSKNGGAWTEMPRTLLVSAGDEVQFRGDNSEYSEDEYYYNSFGEGTTAAFNVKGNIMSLISSSDFATLTTLTSNWTFNYLLKGCRIINASNLVLPATTLADYCYNGMFDGCTSLTTATFVLPATTLADYCYQNMFHGCTSLTTAPELPATTLADYCYANMFDGCTSLTQAPALPATTLAGDCYNSMFYGCTSLTIAPELPATTLASNCYSGMFWACTSLTTVPELPATTLIDACYYSMFQGCTSLTTAPELSAMTLANSCYINMFSGCTSLNYIKAMFTTTPSRGYTRDWVNGVASTGTFVKNIAAAWDVTGVYGIPAGWTVETASV